LIAPSVFTATIFVEPILFVMGQQDNAIAEQTMKRRDTWQNLADVRTAFERSSGLSDWNPQQRKVYAEHGTYDAESGMRMLKTPKEQEAATYLAAPYPDLLNMLEKSKGEHHFIFGQDSRVISASQRQEVQCLPHDREITTMTGAGHLIPMTHPTELSSILAQILDGVFSARRGAGSLLPKL
jgi:pimeloyl-ACP methyl ester carboxylesterase